MKAEPWTDDTGSGRPLILPICDDAIARHGAALEVAPELAHAHYNLGVVDSRLGRMRSAKQAYPIRLRALLVLLLVVAGCERERPTLSESKAPSAVSTEPEPRIVLLVSIDSLRADHLGTYGYERPTSPHIDRLANEGVVFEDASSASTWTLPAHASLLRGVYPDRHGLRSYRRRGASPRDATLSSWLSARGFVTSAVVNSFFVSSRYGFDRGFDDFLYVQEAVERTSPSTWVTDQAMSWLERDPAARIFLFVHYYDVHSDYRALPDYEREFVRPFDGVADGTTSQLKQVEKGELRLDASDAAHLRDRYDAGVRQTDDELGRLLGFLRVKGWLDETLLVLTSDHGEELLDRGGVLHGRTQYQELLRVPLVLRGPGLPPGVRISQPVSLVDVAPTILAILGIPDPGELDGRDLSPLWSEQTADAALLGRVLLSDSVHGDPPRRTRAARQGRYKLHLDVSSGRQLLFDLEDDAGEQRDLAASLPEVAAALLGHLGKRGGVGAQPVELPSLPPEDEERLRALGYVE